MIPPPQRSQPRTWTPLSLNADLRRIVRFARNARPWRPSTFALLYGNLFGRRRNESQGFTDRDHLEAAAQWLARAQDATGNGGVAGRYSLTRGWTSAYPETTGYIIPTFLALESRAGLGGYRERARRCVEFLLSVQLPSGAFPGLEIDENRTEPSVFNTAQILHGLTSWATATGDERTLDAARKAADWLVDTQDADGAWRKSLYGSGRTYTYMAHAGCWVAEFGERFSSPRHLDSAQRHLDWVLGHAHEANGWIDDCGFGEEDQVARRAVTHTIAYTVWGVLMMSRILGDQRGLAQARLAAEGIARRLELSRWLPGKLDSTWKGAATYACLTGNAQMALIWFELHRLVSTPTLVSAGCKAIDLVKRAQPLSSSDPGIRGGIPGSDPIWGDYITLAIPNWAAKFFIDALLEKDRVLKELVLPSSGDLVPRIVSRSTESTPPIDSKTSGGDVRVVLVASEESHKVQQFCEAWRAWDFRPTAVVIRRSAPQKRVVRLRTFVTENGFGALVSRFAKAATPNPSAEGRPSVAAVEVTPREYCNARGIELIEVSSLEATADLDAMRKLEADVFVYAGCGIMRRAVLSVPRLGTLNSHMGLLPPMRGMNVTEWSAFCGVPIGCSVHLVDTGIDTGDILVTRQIDARGARSVAELRAVVDKVQVDLLGSVVRSIMTTGSLPPRTPQAASEGRQFFVMHDDLKQKLERSLAEGLLGRGPDEARSHGKIGVTA